MTSRSKWAALVTLLAVAGLALLVLAEGAVRLRQYVKYGLVTSLDSIYRTDASIGLRVLVPNARQGRVSINSLGFRGPEIPQDKPTNRFRIAFVGASTNFCAEVSDDQSAWPHVVVEQLRQRYPGIDFDYINAGVPGYSVESSLRQYQHFVGRLQPDLVVIYHATNDLSYEARQLALKAGIIRNTQLDRQSWLQRHSLLWDLAVKNIRILVAQQGADTAQGRLNIDASLLGSEFRHDLAALIDAARGTGAAVAVATFSTRLRPEQSVEEKKRAAVSALIYMPFMTLDGLVAAYARYNLLIREVASEKGVSVIGGEGDIPGDATHFFDTVHFTDAGSRAMATRVVSSLIADGRINGLIESHRKR